MSNFELDHHHDASIDFVTDVILYGRDHPPAKYWKKGELQETGKFPSFVVVKARRETRQYKTKKTAGVTVYKFVLMDGSETLFKAVTNSGLSMLLDKYEVWPGSTLVVKKFEMVWMQSGEDFEWRFAMLIQNMAWINPPDHAPVCLHKSLTQNMPAGNDRGTIEKKGTHPTMKISLWAIDAVEKEGVVVFTLPLLNDPKRYVWNQMANLPCTLEQLQHGDWINQPSSRCDWHAFVKPMMAKLIIDKEESHTAGLAPWEMRSRANSNSDEEGEGPCRCETEFGFVDCMKSAFPIAQMDLDELFASCTRRLNGNVDADSFEGLTPRHKRWCIYWWYAVNIYQIRSEARPLPPCLVDYVRTVFPNPAGEFFTGFRPTEERVARIEE